MEPEIDFCTRELRILSVFYRLPAESLKSFAKIFGFRNAAGEAQSTVDIDCRIDGVNVRFIDLLCFPVFYCIFEFDRVEEFIATFS